MMSPKSSRSYNLEFCMDHVGKYNEHISNDSTDPTRISSTSPKCNLSTAASFSFRATACDLSLSMVLWTSEWASRAKETLVQLVGSPCRPVMVTSATFNSSFQSSTSATSRKSFKSYKVSARHGYPTLPGTNHPLTISGLFLYPTVRNRPTQIHRNATSSRR